MSGNDFQVYSVWETSHIFVSFSFKKPHLFFFFSFELTLVINMTDFIHSEMVEETLMLTPGILETSHKLLYFKFKLK